MFDADRPIEKSSEDFLNRAVFAKCLARCMLDHRDPQSLVVGLYGGWGVGKTSIINLMREELDFAASNMLDEEKPIVLNFSAWSYSGQGQLIYSFFRRLSSALRQVPYLENANQIIYLLELYVSFFTQKSIPKPLRLKQASLLKKLIPYRHEEVYAWESGRDLTLVKAELNSYLHKQKHKIIIIIDNISRLYDVEIKQIFQIVKSMGDYANTVYLLAFDEDQVIQAINKIDGSGGEQYIEKIVQLPFYIPPILQQDLEKILANRLQEVLINVPKEAWDNAYWSDIYYSALKFFFENCRDITRYINTLNFSYYRLRDVVNPVDFFALTAIEVFSPTIYFAIRENKDLFTDLLDQVYSMDETQIQQDKSRCDQILLHGERMPRDILLALLVRLFPRLRKIYSPELTFYYSDTAARKQRRICSPDLFDIYFSLSIQLGQIPESQFEAILNSATEIKTFNQALARLNQDDRIMQFLDLMDGKAIDQVPVTIIQVIISGLINNGDFFPPGIRGPLNLDTPMRMHRIVHRLLHRLEKTEDRFLILQNAIGNASKSLYTAIYELREQTREHTEETDTFLPLSYRTLTPEQLNLLRDTVVLRIKSWASNGRLTDHPQLLPILFAWRDWGDEEECQDFVKQMTDSDRGLVTFLQLTLDKAISEAMTAYQKNPQWEQYLADINSFIPAKMLEEHAKTLFEDIYFEKLREREQLALMIFLDLINAKTNKVIPKTSP